MIWTKDEDNFLIENYGKMNNAKILDGIQNTHTRQALLIRARKLGLAKSRKTNHKKIWTDDKIDLMRKLWPNGTKEEIETAFYPYTYIQVGDMAAKFKIVKNPDLKFNNKLKILLEDNLFNWYWYGFIIGDGHITEDGEVRISLTKADHNHLDKLGKYLDIKVIIHDKQYSYKQYTSKATCYLGVKDVIYGQELFNKFKIITPKTYNPCSLECIKTDEQFLAFLIGYIDADGYIGDKKDQMIRIQNHGSWITNLEYFSTKLQTLGVDSVKTKIDARGYANFIIYKQHNFRFLYNFVKLHNLPVLERKWSKLDYLYNINS
jgi:hypothetical protein